MGHQAWNDYRKTSSVVRGTRALYGEVDRETLTLSVERWTVGHRVLTEGLRVLSLESQAWDIDRGT